MIVIRPLERHEFSKVREIDVTETGDVIFHKINGEIVPVEHHWQRRPWSEARCQEIILDWHGAVDGGGVVLGALDGDKLVGEAVLLPRLTETMAQLQYLHVSRACRRQGVARRLTEEIIRLARESGAEALYVSATETPSAQGFYRSMGFMPTDTPHPRLLELEPNDIHMTMRL